MAKQEDVMQLIDTRVSSVAGGKLTVEFVGEGGELVAVTMATEDRSLDGDNAVRRAKEILVQLTAFDTGAEIVTSGSDAGGDASSPTSGWKGL